MVVLIGITIWSIGFVFFFTLFLDKIFGGKISSVVSHFHFRMKAHEDVERDFQTKELIEGFEEVVKNSESVLFRKLLSIEDRLKKLEDYEE